MLYFFVAVAVVIFLLLLKRSFIRYSLWAAGFALYFYITSSPSGSAKELFSSAGVSKISNSLLDDQTRSALSFYLNASNDRGDFADNLSSLANTRRLDEKQIKSVFDNLSLNKVKEIIHLILDSLNLDKVKI